MEAAKRFDPARNNLFDTFSEHRIRGSILDHLRLVDQTSVSRWHMKFLKDRQKAISNITEEKKLNEEPSEAEIAEGMGMSLEKYHKKIQEYPINPGFVYLSSEKKTKLLKRLAYTMDQSGLGNKEDEGKVELLNRFLSELELTEREFEILNMYFVEEFSLKEIGEKFNVNESRISQIKNKIVERLRKLFEEAGYKVAHENKIYDRHETPGIRSKKASG